MPVKIGRALFGLVSLAGQRGLLFGELPELLLGIGFACSTSGSPRSLGFSQLLFVRVDRGLSRREFVGEFSRLAPAHLQCGQLLVHFQSGAVEPRLFGRRLGFPTRALFVKLALRRLQRAGRGLEFSLAGVQRRTLRLDLAEPGSQRRLLHRQASLGLAPLGIRLQSGLGVLLARGFKPGRLLGDGSFALVMSRHSQLVVRQMLISLCKQCRTLGGQRRHILPELVALAGQRLFAHRQLLLALQSLGNPVCPVIDEGLLVAFDFDPARFELGSLGIPGMQALIEFSRLGGLLLASRFQVVESPLEFARALDELPHALASLSIGQVKAYTQGGKFGRIHRSRMGLICFRLVPRRTRLAVGRGRVGRKNLDLQIAQGQPIPRNQRGIFERPIVQQGLAVQPATRSYAAAREGSRSDAVECPRRAVATCNQRRSPPSTSGSPPERSAEHDRLGKHGASARPMFYRAS